MLAVALMVADGRGKVDSLRHLLSYFLYPAERVVDHLQAAFQTTKLWFQDQQQLVLENRILKRELARLQARTLRYEAILEENLRLRKQLYGRLPFRFEVMSAEVIGMGGLRERHRIKINRGQRDGLFKGMPVFAAEGIVGQVVRVLPLTAEVVLLTDPNHAIPVYVKRTGLRALAVGEGKFDRLRLLFLPETADIDVGDLLLSSGLGGVFPKGYPVAKVVVVEQRPDHAFLEVIARPLARLDRLDEVFLPQSRSPIP